MKRIPAKRILRWIQHREPGLLSPLEVIVRPREPVNGPAPMLVIAACPRSGSTLLYQLLVGTLKLNYISNFQHFFYRQPFLAYRMASLILKPYVSDFRSDYGYIGGLNGPAEGYAFWNYWFDQDMEERTPVPNPRRLFNIQNYFRWLHNHTKRPFVSGWIGHTFYFKEMGDLFPDAVFICLHRDLLSIACSLFIGRRVNGPNPTNWWSLKPIECMNLEHLSVHQQVAHQAFYVDKKLREQQKKFVDRVINIDYHQLCKQPNGVIDLVCEAVMKKGFEIQYRQDTFIDGKFQPSRHPTDSDEDVDRIHGFLAQLESNESSKQ